MGDKEVEELSIYIS